MSNNEASFTKTAKSRYLTAYHNQTIDQVNLEQLEEKCETALLLTQTTLSDSKSTKADLVTMLRQLAGTTAVLKVTMHREVGALNSVLRKAVEGVKVNKSAALAMRDLVHWIATGKKPT